MIFSKKITITNKLIISFGYLFETNFVQITAHTAYFFNFIFLIFI